MAVPSTGPITMLGVAQERKYGSYGFGTISSPITMFDLLNGGGANAFPSLNSCPQPNVPSYSMSGWYGYNQTASCVSCVPSFLRFSNTNFTACSSEPNIFYTTSSTPFAPWQDNSPIFNDDTCSSPALSGYYSNGLQSAKYFNGNWGRVSPCQI